MKNKKKDSNTRYKDIHVQDIIWQIQDSDNTSSHQQLTSLLEEKFQTSFDEIVTLDCVKTCILNDEERRTYDQIISESTSLSTSLSEKKMTPYYR